MVERLRDAADRIFTANRGHAPSKTAAARLSIPVAHSARGRAYHRPSCAVAILHA
jgi:hypothetical protein